MSVDRDLEAFERRMQLDRQRLPIEEEARQAQAGGDLARAAALWTRSLDLARQGGDDVSRWYVEGQLADVLIKCGRVDEAMQLLEASVRAGNDLPFAHSLLIDIYMERRAFDDAFCVRHGSWQSISKRAERNGMPPIDPSAQIVGFAKWWKATGSDRPIALAEKWAEEAQARGAWFAVRHERAQFLEKQDAAAAALELYLALVLQGSKHDATYTRAMILLERAKRSDESLALARAIPGLGLSASLEEQARKRVARLETKGQTRSASTARGPKQPKAVVPAFSIRSGDPALRWSQVEIKGGVSSIIPIPTGVYVTGGTEPALWWIASGATEPTRLRPIAKRTRLHLSHGAALVTDEGTVKEGRARVEVLGTDWSTIATIDLPGVTSEVTPTSWGIAIGCRSGGLYAVGWDGVMRWRFDVPERADASPFGAACPYFVSSAAADGTVVFSSYADVYALTAQGRVAWAWRLPSPQSIGGLISVSMPVSVSAIGATREGGVWIGSQDGGVFHLNAHGKLVWSTNAGGNVSQLVLDHEDRLLAIGHSGGIAVTGAHGSLTTVVESRRWPRVVRSADGRWFVTTEGKVLSLLDGTGRPHAVVELSRSISDAAITAEHIVVAAGKLVFLEVPRA